MEKRKIMIGTIVLIIIFILGFMTSRYGVLLTGNIIENKNAIKTPADYLNNDDFLVYSDKVVLKIENAKITNYVSESMLPFLGEGANGIVVSVESEEEVNVGDVISFRRGESIIVHRVIEKGIDSEGIYFITKGDNVDFADRKIRFEQIEHKLIGIIY